MKTAIRTHVAAAVMLFLPVAAVVVAQPAAAQQRAVVAQAVGIRSMALDSSAGLAPGSVLRVQVFATPGARNAHAVLGRDGVRVALREQAPGTYVGTHTIRRGERIDPSKRITARVAFRDGTVAQRFDFPPAFQALAMGANRRDRQAPQISDVTPGNGVRMEERGRTHIFARLSDDRSGVDPASVRLKVDGVDVTSDARVSEDEIRYRERLGRGRHDAELVVQDKAGNVARSAWSFRVQ